MSSREPELSVVLGDCIEVMAAMPAASVDAIVTDPPYGLGFMGKEWDTIGDTGRGARARAERAAEVTPNGRGHTTSGGPYLAVGVDSLRSAGAPYQRWCELWAREALRLLKPGGYLLAFGGTRTAHRLVCAIEDAGFEIRDTIAWLYASGFPKSLDVSKAIDKVAGAEREVVGQERDRWTGAGAILNFATDRTQDTVPITGAPATPDAERWNGWGTALKPAHEPIVVARKPLTGTVAANVLAHGCGALNVDGCRIGTADKLGGGAERRVAVEGKHEGWTRPWMTDVPAVDAHTTRVRANVEKAEALGRWPANVCLDEQAAALLDAQTGTLTSGANPTRRGSDKFRLAYGDFEGQRECEPARGSDSGGASRFLYVAKASAAERSAGLDGFEEQSAGVHDDDAYVWPLNGDGSPRGRKVNPRANVHPTVKPIALMRWLVRLVTPPGGTVLDPFAGSGTTGIAAALEGLRFIGIEREAEYVAIAQARIAWWARHPDGMTLVKRLEAEAEQAATIAAGQGSLFDVPGAPSTSSNGRDGEASAEARYADRGASNFAMKPGRRR